MDINSKLRQLDYFMEIRACLQECSSKIIEIYNEFDQSITYKPDNSPLTKADIVSHELIEKRLSSISSYPIISEESDNFYTKESKYWLVDPLDGTKEFISKNGEFTINIALIENRYPILGYVYSPINKTLYVGGLNKGAFKVIDSNIEELFVSSSQDPIRIVASRNHLNEETKKYISQFKNFTLLQAGSSIKLCMIAEGSADIYPRLAPTSEWDTAAAQAIVEGAGGSVQDLKNKRFIYQKDNILNPHFIVRGMN
jgi:3'(2'), 5'-bisphosphate nucleotidase